MTAANAIVMDTTEFRQALEEYAVASRKTLADAMNRQVVNIGIQGLRTMRVADRATIQRIESDPNVIKKVAREAGMWAGARRAIYLAMTGYVGKNFSSKGNDKMRALGWKYMRKLIARRLAATAFLRGFFASLARTGGKTVSAKAFRGMQAGFDRASESTHPRAMYQVLYRYRRNRESAKAQSLLDAAHRAAIDAATADMQIYMARKMQEAAQRIAPR